MGNMPAAAASTRDTSGKALLDLGGENLHISVLAGDPNKPTLAHPFGAQSPERFFVFGTGRPSTISVPASDAPIQPTKSLRTPPHTPSQGPRRPRAKNTASPRVESRRRIAALSLAGGRAE